MTVSERTNALSKVNRSLVGVLNTIANWALALMMFLTFSDVLLRYLFNKPILGSAELIEFLMAIVVPFSIAYCAHERSHISVELIVERFSLKTRKVLDCVINLLMLCLFMIASWQSLLYLIDEAHSRLTSQVLYIPVYPFIGTVAFAFLVFSLILLEQLWESLLEVKAQWTLS